MKPKPPSIPGADIGCKLHELIRIAGERSVKLLVNDFYGFKTYVVSIYGNLKECKKVVDATRRMKPAAMRVGDIYVFHDSSEDLPSLLEKALVAMRKLKK